MKRSIRIFSFAMVLAVMAFGIAFVVLPLPGTVPVLMYHFVGTNEDAEASKNFVSQESFERQMAFLSRFGYRVISLEDYRRRLTGKEKWRGKEIAITFDDGNYTFESHALAVLENYRFPVTLFVISENVKGKLHGSMAEETIRRLLEKDWISIGSHTRTSPYLTQIPVGEMRQELIGSKEDLETMFGVPIRFLAYPAGDFDGRVAEAVKQAGYDLAFTTSPKKLGSVPEGPYAITRTKISRTSDNLLVFWVKICGLYQSFKRLRHEIRVRIGGAGRVGRRIVKPGFRSR